MKKIIVLFLSFGFFLTSFAQKGLEVEITKIPEQVEILPDLYEFFGTVKGQPDQFSYVLTMNEKLVEQLRKAAENGEKISFLGPKLEKLVQEKILNDYARKRKEVESQAEEELDEAKKVLKSAERDEKKDAVIDKKAAQKNLAKEKSSTKEYLAQLQKIVMRYNTNCIYAYNSATSSSGSDNSSGLGDDNVEGLAR